MTSEAITSSSFVVVEEKGWWLYIVETVSGKLYTGITTDVERRFREHSDKAGSRGAKFFRSDPAKALVYREACADRSVASKREYAIKKMSAQKKRQLIASNA